MARARKSLSKKTRFEVFKRDSFTCQYCGKSAPEVILHIDHILAVANGGSNEIINLITSCADCNLGKGPVALSDHSVASKQMNAAKELNESHEQLKLMAQWRKGLTDLLDEKVKNAETLFRDLTGRGINEFGKRDLRLAIKKFGLDDVIDAIERSVSQYVQDSENEEQVEKALSYVPKICYWTNKKRTQPEIEKFGHICNVAAKYWWSHSRQRLWQIIQEAHYKYEINLDAMLELARRSTGITAFQNNLQALIEGGPHG